MNSIGSFFSRIQGVFAGKIVLYSSAQEIIKKVAGIEVPLEALSFSGKSLIIKGLDQAARSVIFIKKSAILKELNQKIPGRVIEDIR